MTLQVRIDGINELNKRLNGISVMTRGKAGRTALRKAAKVIAEKAKANAARIDDPATPESIPANIAVQFGSRHFKKTGDLMMRVGVLGGARKYGNTKQNRRKQRVGKTYIQPGGKENPGGDTYYWWHVELGTIKRVATPFLRPAAIQMSGAALSAFITEYSKSLDRFAKRGIR